MLEWSSKVDSVRIAFRFLLPDRTPCWLPDRTPCRLSVIPHNNTEVSSQPLAGFGKREILPLHHQVDIITTPPACKAMASIG